MGEDVWQVQRAQEYMRALQRSKQLVVEMREALDRPPITAAIDPFLCLYDVYETMCGMSLTAEEEQAMRTFSQLAALHNHRSLMTIVASLPFASTALRETALASRNRSKLSATSTVKLAVNAGAAELRLSLRAKLLDFGNTLRAKLLPVMEACLASLNWPQTRRALLSADSHVIGSFSRLFASVLLLQLAGSFVCFSAIC